MAGTVGFLLILSSFVATVVAAFAFFRASAELNDSVSWTKIGRFAWVISSGAILASFVILVYLVFTHQFQYGYVYENSSRDLPLNFLISSTWAGQEGSFLLWLMLNGLVEFARGVSPGFCRKPVVIQCDLPTDIGVISIR